MAKKSEKTPNNRALNDRLRDILAVELEQLPATLEALPPQERIKAIIELLPYAAPKIKPAQEKDNSPNGWDWPTL